MITKEMFEALDPESRGYTVYLAGSREDEPNVPDEANPYLRKSKAYELWARGQRKAYIDELDGVP